MDKDAILTCAELCSLANNSFASVAGFVTVKQMPSTAKGTVFLTLEDETGTSNVICWNSVYKKFRNQVVFSSFLLVHGQLQRENEVSHLIASNVRDISSLLKLIPKIK
ncbi:OB-fold nucleic acid binding domain-containing protein [Paracoccaceae bacterium]|nr:OB-fold nucleic acid binding domain-containing protein [Paracoccaceae bacterium]